jgi:hypothetical protein
MIIESEGAVIKAMGSIGNEEEYDDGISEDEGSRVSKPRQIEPTFGRGGKAESM